MAHLQSKLFGRLRQVDFCKFEASLAYILNSRTARAVQRDCLTPSVKMKNKLKIVWELLVEDDEVEHGCRGEQGSCPPASPGSQHSAPSSQTLPAARAGMTSAGRDAFTLIPRCSPTCRSGSCLATGRIPDPGSRRWCGLSWPMHV